MSIQQRLPSGNGAVMTWTPNVGQAWECVDDPIGFPDDAATVITRADSAGAARFTFAPFTLPGGATNIVLRMFSRHMSSGGFPIALILLISGVNRNIGTDNAVGAVFEDFTTNNVVNNPATAAPWTVDEINGIGAAAVAEFGLTLPILDPGVTQTCTQMYLEVEYTEPAPAPGDDSALTRYRYRY